MSEYVGTWAIEHRHLGAIERVIRGFKAQVEVKAAAKRPEPERQGQVAIVPIQGPIVKRDGLFSALLGATSVDWLTGTLKTLAADTSVKSVVLAVDSPGGTVAGVGEGARLVANFPKPIVAQVEDLAASAAYWMISGADEIVAAPEAEVGSIGALAEIVDDSAALDKMGIKIHVVASGPRKASGAPPVSEEDLAYVQERVDGIAALFFEAVKDNRGLTRAELDAVTDGSVWLAAEAKERRLVDRIGNLDYAVGRAVKLAPASRRALASLKLAVR